MVKFPPLSPKRAAAIAVVMIVGFSVMWWAVWQLAARQYRHAIDHWIEVGRADGDHVEFDKNRIFGFPHRVVMRLNNVRWNSADGMAFHADQMDLSATPWQWTIFDAHMEGHIELSAPLTNDTRTLTLGGDDGRAHVELNSDGTWQLSRVSLGHAHVGRVPDTVFEAENLTAEAHRPDAPPKDSKQPGLLLEAEAEKVKLPSIMPSPFGASMESMKAKLRVMGEMPDFRNRNSVAIWNHGMGVIAFDKLNMEWGPLLFAGKGTIGFDDDLQPEGAFSSAVGHHHEVLAALMQGGFIPQRQMGMLSSALDLFAKPADDVEGVELPITVQLGGLFLGPVKVFGFPQIEWAEETQEPVKADPPVPEAPVSP
jgi:hypothetical protein